MNILTKLIGFKQDMTLEEAITAFKVSPARWFWYRHLPYEWVLSDLASLAPVCLDDLCVLVEDHPLGYVEGVRYIAGGTVIIHHIAVEKTLLRRQIGTTLARAYAHELATRYDVKRIVFSEIHEHFYAAGYPAFFEALGARALPMDIPLIRNCHPCYEWLENCWANPG